MATQLSRSQRAADAVTIFCGSWTFVFIFAALTAVWIGLNTVQILFRPFDPYPFILLNLFFTVIELFQGPLIMMSQNRDTERQREMERREMERDREAIQGIHNKLDDILSRVGVN